MTTAGRPPIDKITSGAELRSWYWLKSDLIDNARRLGLPVSGGKFEILDRIALYLDTGKIERPKPARASSRFDWHAAPLDDDTVLTDSYRNTQNVRRYFQSRLGSSFRFNIEFMAWLKAHEGATLAEACDEYRAMKQREAAPDFQSRIADHNQFNQYTRDFLADNPALGMAEVRHFWALKSAQRSSTGRHVYDPSDLDLKG